MPSGTVIAISASADEHTQQQSIAAGCDAFIAKPLRLETFLETIGELLWLEWIYAPSTNFEIDQDQFFSETTVTHAKFVHPPTPELQRLLDFVNKGMILDIRHWLDRIERLDAKYAPFTTKIRQLSENFDFEEIYELLKR